MAVKPPGQRFSGAVPVKDGRASVSMRTLRTVRPGARGTMALVEEFGERLVCVRYRYDDSAGKCYTTAEIIVREGEWKPRVDPPKADPMVWVRVRWGERDVALRIREAGGCWDADRRLWNMPLSKARALGFESRIVEESSF
ncbi:MAG: hypothetical protein HZB55_09875 [Deltaproteobacteria bacterium]|nr:hypothetical protein [Deltaproteobacteria bacterium]